MKAVILAGGLGTRLYPITKEIPKPLLPIHRKPIINYLVELFLRQGIKDIAVLVNEEFEDDFIWWKKRYYPFENSYSFPNIKIFKEEKQLGTFGGLAYLKDWLSKDEPFFLTNGDELKEVDLGKMIDFHKEKTPVATIALFKSDSPQNYGVAICKEGMIEEFIEKPVNPPSPYINSGLYLISPQIFNYHPGPQFLMIEKDIFPKLAKEHKLAGFQFEGKWRDCGTWERYTDAQNNLSNNTI